MMKAFNERALAVGLDGDDLLQRIVITETLLNPDAQRYHAETRLRHGGSLVLTAYGSTPSEAAANLSATVEEYRAHVQQRRAS